MTITLRSQWIENVALWQLFCSCPFLDIPTLPVGDAGAAKVLLQADHERLRAGTDEFEKAPQQPTGLGWRNGLLETHQKDVDELVEQMRAMEVAEMAVDDAIAIK